MKKLGSIENKIIPGIFFGVLILIWEIVVDIGLVQRFLLPSPLDVIKTTVLIMGELRINILITLYEAGIGFILAGLFAIIIAVAMDSIKIVRKAVYPILIISQTIPIIAIAPLFALWFGFGTLPKIIVVILVCFFPIVVNLLDGLQSVDEEILYLMKSMGGSRMKIFTMVKFPSSMIAFFSGLKIAATYSIMGAIIGEWLGGDGGLGVYMINAKHSYATDKVFSVILVIILLSMLLFKIIDILQYFAMPWNRKYNKN